MEPMESTSGILNLMIQPAFTVKDGIIDVVNEAASKYFIEPGTPVKELLLTGHSEYQEFKEGCLYLTLSIADIPCGASVRHFDAYDLFTVEQEKEQLELQALALAAQELRMPLSNVMTVADQMFPVANQENNPKIQEQMSRINRGLYQMLRMIGNMSDAHRYTQQADKILPAHEITKFIEEVFRKAETLLQHADVRLEFTNVKSSIICMVDSEKLERGIHNMLSNAVKFSQPGSTIYARLTQKGHMLYLSVQDSGVGISAEMKGNVHARFRRGPGLEDSRYGIGLGMLMIRSAASVHGGTVLIDHPDGCGTRVTMSLQIRKNSSATVRSPIILFDYTGEHDHALVEFSNILPADIYRSRNIN